jgi:hypothetical protein
VKLWDWYCARRERKEREEYLRQKARDDAWAADPGKAMHDAGERIAEVNKPWNQPGEW